MMDEEWRYVCAHCGYILENEVEPTGILENRPDCPKCFSLVVEPKIIFVVSR